MIRRLRLRFILIVMAILTLIFTAVLLTFNCLFFNDTCSQAIHQPEFLQFLPAFYNTPA